MLSHPKLQQTSAATATTLPTVDHSIAGVFAGSGITLFGFLITIILLA